MSERTGFALVAQSVERVLGKDEVSSSILDEGSLAAARRNGSHGGNRTIITLECKICKERNYTTTKNKKKTQDKLTRSKYCPRCRKHVDHKEAK